jgi:hypothetical protein
VAKIVQCPLVQHLRQRDLTRRLVPRLAFAVVQRKPAQQLDMVLRWSSKWPKSDSGSAFL